MYIKSPPPPPPPSKKLALLAATALLSATQLALAAPGVSLGTKQSNMGGSELTLQLTCGTKGYLATGVGASHETYLGQRQRSDGSNTTPLESGLVNLASTYFYVRGTGIGRASDDGNFSPLPENHPGRAWGAKRWGDLWGAVMQPRYEVDIELTATPQPDPPVYFVTNNTSGIPVESKTMTVQRRYDTPYTAQNVSLVRYCDLDSKETISVTINGRIAGKRPL